ASVGELPVLALEVGDLCSLDDAEPVPLIVAQRDRPILAGERSVDTDDDSMSWRPSRLGSHQILPVLAAAVRLPELDRDWNDAPFLTAWRERPHLDMAPQRGE